MTAMPTSRLCTISLHRNTDAASGDAYHEEGDVHCLPGFPAG